MTDERKVELYNELLGYICELISDEKELVRTLIRLGFTEEELIEEGLMEEGEWAMERFRQFIIRELGLDDVEDERLLTLYNELGIETIEKLYSQDYYLLHLIHFEEDYKKDREVLIKVIDCDGWDEIALYRVIYK